MTAHFCRECYAQIPPTARTGCCEQCRPVRRHSHNRNPDRSRRLAEKDRPTQYLT